MDVEMRGRMYALELLTTQLISEYLRTVPDAAAQTKWAKGHLHEAAETLAVETESLDDEARLRVGMKGHVNRILDAALLRAQATPLIPTASLGRWARGRIVACAAVS
jgi:hypothetical protein